MRLIEPPETIVTEAVAWLFASFDSVIALPLSAVILIVYVPTEEGVHVPEVTLPVPLETKTPRLRSGEMVDQVEPLNTSNLLEKPAPVV